jgi:hypothetical protein
LLGAQTLADKEKEGQLLTRFVSLADNGKYLGWFIDQTFAGEQLEDARRRLASLSRTAVARQVNLTSMRSNSGWTLSFGIAEPIQELFVQLPGRARESTGFLGSIDQQTGKPAPRPFIELPGNAQTMVIEASYRDANGQLRGPFRMTFDPDAALFSGMKDILEMTRTSWLAFRDYDGRRLLYFTHLISSRCAIAEVRYGLDTMSPSQVYTMPPCDKANPYSVPSDATIYIQTPPATRFASVQIRYRDGAQSAVQRVDMQ